MHLTRENLESVNPRQQLCPHSTQEQRRVEASQSCARQQEGPLIWPEAGNRMNVSPSFSETKGAEGTSMAVGSEGLSLKQTQEIALLS